MSLAFCFDQHVPGASRGLRRRGVSVLTAEEDGSKELDDELLLVRATALDRIVVSMDKDFRRIAARWLVTGRSFAGVLAITDLYVGYGKLIDDLLVVAEVHSSEEMANRIEHLPL